ncbi:uncharacterized protein LOC105829237 [Monomorium pharaonis]|uniref:uncharacterized protein LOC105829237 n=1 Tax=Monomorium pharaonis TaxID=307658 RepID=UPI00102E12F4|nr:uncharacterized protein LOC105829237 [Monomorium pharaonis]
MIVRCHDRGDLIWLRFNFNVATIWLTPIFRQQTVKITKFQMGWGLTRTQCQCNDSASARAQAPSKQVLAACPPIITAVKSTCGVKRMLVSIVILIFLLATIYWVSSRQQANPGQRRQIRIQPQASRNIASERTEATEMSER